MNDQKRMDYLDLLKAIGILMVLTLHIPLWQPYFIETGKATDTVQYGMRLISEGVPLFVTVNGLLLLKKEKLDLKKHLKKMLKMFLLLILWSTILTICAYQLREQMEPMTLKGVFYCVLNTQVSNQCNGILWFLQSLLAVYLIYPALHCIYKNHFEIFRYLFWVVSVFVLGTTTLIQLRDMCSVLCDVEGLNYFLGFVNQYNPVANGWFVFCFMLGGMLWHDMDHIKEHRKRWILIGICSWPVAFGYGYFVSVKAGFTYNPALNYNSICITLFMIGLFAATLSFKGNKNIFTKVLVNLGQNTFGIYLCHYVFIFILEYYWDFSLRFQDRLLAYVIVLIGSYLFTLVVKRIPYVKYIIEL